MKVLVCGGRDYGETKGDLGFLFGCLDKLHEDRTITEVIHGGARGADSLAGSWAKHRGVPVRVFRAQWDKQGRAAGHIRNALMLSEGKPDLVVAFRGGRGTANMVQQAKKAGVTVREPRAP